jgi:dTMP kinase
VPVEEGLARKSKQSADQPGEWNRYEAQVTAFHQRVRDGYHALAEAEPSRWRLVDGRQTPEAIASQIWSHVEVLLK